ncbi:hypothetical protein N9A28_06545 [Sulfurimonas sp.]|nr:hypothetical protein [Sulfurimonas sp.]
MASKKVKTRNIANSVSKFASEHILKTSEYSFNINSIDTYVKSVADDDYILYNEDFHDYYNNFDKLINEHAEFRQTYVITVKKNTKRIIDLKYKIDFSPGNALPSIILDPSSIIPYKKYQAKEMYLLLLKELNNIKAYNKILIKIFDTNMKTKLKAFVKYLYQGKFVKKIKIPLFDGLEPEVTVSSKIIKHYLKKENSHQIIEVSPKETLIEYIKPVFGKNGLSSFGQIITHDNTSNKDDIDQDIIDHNTIEIKETPENKLYRSKIKGFVHFDDNKFYVDNRIKMQQLSSVQDQLAKEEDNNIEVIVAQNDTSVDSVGEGVELRSETVHITGHIGAKTLVEATTLTIDGATHQNSKQEARVATINRHKGTLRCQTANVKLLEGGEIHATDANIETAMGGSIYAENITIKTLKSNVKIYASKSITVKLVTGEDNKFKITYKDIPTIVSKNRFFEKEVEELKYELEGALKHSPDQVSIIKDKITDIKNQQKEIKECAKTAKILIEEPLTGVNSISFVLSSDEEITYKTDARKYKEFYLEESDGYILLQPTNAKIKIDE